jgi:hypothetical protein
MGMMLPSVKSFFHVSHPLVYFISCYPILKILNALQEDNDQAFSQSR